MIEGVDSHNDACPMSAQHCSEEKLEGEEWREGGHDEIMRTTELI